MPKLPEPAKGAKEGDKKDAAAEPPPFTIVVERQTQSGSWMEKERVEDVTLEQVEEEGEKKVKVLYKNNKAPQWIDLEVPESKTPLAKIWPKEEQQVLLVSGDAGAVKRVWLRSNWMETIWLSAFTGSIPVPCICKETKFP